MFKRLVLIVICAVFLVTALVAAQQPPPPPQAAPRPEAQASTPAPPPRPRPLGQMVTVRIEITVTDQIGTAAPTKKTMTLLAADGERSSVRSLNRGQGGPAPNANFNVDATPILAQDKILLNLSIFYDPPYAAVAEPGGEKPVPTATTLQESMTVVVDNGKPLVISQSADPRTDRKVTVEVKATILK